MGPVKEGEPESEVGEDQVRDGRTPVLWGEGVESPHEVSGQWYDVGGVVEAAVQRGELIGIDALGPQDASDVAGPCGKLVIGQVDGEGASVQPPPQDDLLLGRDSLGGQLLRSKNGAAGNRFAVAGVGAAGDVSCK